VTNITIREKLSPAHIYCVNTVPIDANGSQGMWATIVASGTVLWAPVIAFGSKRVNQISTRNMDTS